MPLGVGRVHNTQVNTHETISTRAAGKEIQRAGQERVIREGLLEEVTFESREPWWSLRKTVSRESDWGWARRKRPTGREVGVSGGGEAGRVGEHHHIWQKSYTFPQGIRQRRTDGVCCPYSTQADVRQGQTCESHFLCREPPPGPIRGASSALGLAGATSGQRRC